MLAYGGGSVKRRGVFDEICGLLKESGTVKQVWKEVVTWGNSNLVF